MDYPQFFETVKKGIQFIIDSGDSLTLSEMTSHCAMLNDLLFQNFENPNSYEKDVCLHYLYNQMFDKFVQQ